jgi:hypothetical protein
MKKKRAKPYDQMTTAELRKATAEFDREFIADSFHPMSPAERAQWERIRRKMGRPRQGKCVQVISVSVEKDLLARSDRLARRLGVTRAALIARSLSATLLAVGEK